VSDRKAAATLLVVIVTAVLAGVGAARGMFPVLAAWVLVATVVTIGGFSSIDRSIIRERLRRGQKSEDPHRLLVIRMLILIHIVAGFTAAIRGDLSPFPQTLRLAALIPFAAGLTWTWWSLSVNPFFVPVIRLQEERGHRVISAGPYRFLRHPGYSGLIVSLPASGLALGSWISFAASVLAAFLFVRRAAHEDRFLLERLSEYPAYAGRVRFRLIPGVW
jgi:protein-S-isoprenylcysteine O-methyltransferase Ste14